MAPAFQIPNRHQQILYNEPVVQGGSVPWMPYQTSIPTALQELVILLGMT